MKRVLLIIAMALCALPCAAQYLYVPVSQSDVGPTGTTGGAWSTCTTSQNVTIGQMEFVWTQWYGTTNNPSVSSTLVGSSSNWTQVLLDNGYSSGGQAAAIYVGFAASGGATDTITASTSGATYQTTTCAVLPPNWSTTLDGTPSCTVIPGNPSTQVTPNITTSYNNSLLLPMITGGHNSSAFAPANIGVSYYLGFKAANDAIGNAVQVAGAAGTYNMTWNTYNPGSGGMVCIAALKLANTGITFTTPTSLPDSIVGNAYSYTPLAVGGQGSYTWSKTAGSLPGGLSLNSSTGAITGTVSGSTGNFSFTLSVTDGTNTQTQNATIKIGSSLNTPTVHCTNVASAFNTASLVCNPVTVGDTIFAQGGGGTSSGNTSTFAFYCTDSFGTVFNVARLDYIGFGSSDFFGTSEVLVGVAAGSGSDTITCSSVKSLYSVASVAGLSDAAGDNSLVTTGVNSSTPQVVTSSTLTTLAPDEWLYATGSCYNASCVPTPQSPFTDIGGGLLQCDASYDQATTVSGYSISYSIATNNTFPYTLQLLGIRPSAAMPSARRAIVHAG